MDRKRFQDSASDSGWMSEAATVTWWKQPLHDADRFAVRFMCRLLTAVSGWQIRGMHGLEHVAPGRDPFILALNHSQRPEAVLVPAWLCLHRNGRLVHFMADWNFLLVPGLSWLIRLHDPIVVVRKPAKPAFLNRFKSRFEGGCRPFDEARARLKQGRSVGIFPEATVNRHPEELLRGQSGVARLAIESQVPVVPGGIRFERAGRTGPIRDWEPFAVRFGPALQPPGPRNLEPDSIAGFHQQIMCAISTLSGKRWQPDGRRTKYAFAKP